MPVPDVFLANELPVAPLKVLLVVLDGARDVEHHIHAVCHGAADHERTLRVLHLAKAALLLGQRIRVAALAQCVQVNRGVLSDDLRTSFIPQIRVLVDATRVDPLQFKAFVLAFDLTSNQKAFFAEAQVALQSVPHCFRLTAALAKPVARWNAVEKRIVESVAVEVRGALAAVTDHKLISLFELVVETNVATHQIIVVVSHTVILRLADPFTFQARLLCHLLVVLAAVVRPGMLILGRRPQGLRYPCQFSGLIDACSVS